MEKRIVEWSTKPPLALNLERLKEIILKETDIDVSKNSRKHNIIEARALYFYLVKHFLILY